MQPFYNSIRSIVIRVVLFMAAAAVLYLVLPAYRTMLAGFLLGAFVSLLNGFILATKAVHISEVALGHRKRSGSGMLQRFLLAGLAIYVGIKFPVIFDTAGIILGLMVVTVVGYFHGVAQLFKEERSTEERGET
jgi:ATP synthase protein I